MIQRILGVIFIVISACGRSSDKPNELSDYLSSVGIVNPEKVLLIYLDGCIGCFHHHKMLVEKAKKSGDYEIVLVTKSKKKAILIFGEELVQDMIFDTELMALDYALVTGFPTLFIFDQSGRLDRKYEVDYRTNNIQLP